MYASEDDRCGDAPPRDRIGSEAALPISRGGLTTITSLRKIESLAEVAQLVEHAAENRGVPSPILGLGTTVCDLVVW